MIFSGFSFFSVFSTTWEFSSSQDINFSVKRSLLIALLNFSISILLGDFSISYLNSSIFESISFSATVIFSLSDRAFRAKFFITFSSACGLLDSASDFITSGVNVDLISIPCWANLWAVCSILFLTSLSINDLGISTSNSLASASIRASFLMFFWFSLKFSLSLVSISFFSSFNVSLFADCFANESSKSGNSLIFRSFNVISKIASFPLESSWA